MASICFSILFPLCSFSICHSCIMNMEIFVKNFSGTAYRIVDCYYTPGIYEVYRGYIVFVFSVKMFVCVCVCVCVNFFSVKDFSGTT